MTLNLLLIALHPWQTIVTIRAEKVDGDESPIDSPVVAAEPSDESLSDPEENETWAQVVRRGRSSRQRKPRIPQLHELPVSKFSAYEEVPLHNQFDALSAVLDEESAETAAAEATPEEHSDDESWIDSEDEDDQAFYDASDDELNVPLWDDDEDDEDKEWADSSDNDVDSDDESEAGLAFGRGPMNAAAASRITPEHLPTIVEAN